MMRSPRTSRLRDVKTLKMPTLAHCMVDLETLGKTPGAALMSIGAVMFDPVTGQLGETFYRNILPSSCEALGMHRDPETEAWWARQPREAWDALRVNQLWVAHALSEFSRFWVNSPATYFWSHGANFDEVLLRVAFDATKLTTPWHYTNVRCCRTILGVAHLRPDRAQGVHHHALDDARAQALAVIEAYRKLGLSTAQAVP